MLKDANLRRATQFVRALRLNLGGQPLHAEHYDANVPVAALSTI